MLKILKEISDKFFKQKKTEEPAAVEVPSARMMPGPIKFKVKRRSKTGQTKGAFGGPRP